MTQLLPLVIIPLLTCLVVLAGMTHSLLPGEPLRLSVPLFAMAAAIYSVTFFMAAVTASARHGYELAALVIVLYVGYYLTQGGWWWYYDWESLYLYGAFDWYLSPHQLFPLANLLLVGAATCLLPYFARLSFERREC